MTKALLKIKNLKIHFIKSESVVKAVDDISFQIIEGETLGIVGESGSGKSSVALSIMQLIPTPPGKVSGEILFNNSNLLTKSEKEMRKIRGNQLSMIFQDSMSSLNPVYTIGDQVAEVIQIHKNKSKKEALDIVTNLFCTVGIPLPEQRIHEYPHQLSGGMKQRVMIAMALSCEPLLLIADEPTTALDVTIQAQILELIKKLKHDSNTSIMLITHDLGVILEVSDRVIVMYAGKILECADVETLLLNPQHPYTQGLIESIPEIEDDKKRLKTINGKISEVNSFPNGCKFYSRCKYAIGGCDKFEPELTERSEGHFVRCFL